MRAAFVIYCLLLILEGLMAWRDTGGNFLMAVSVSGLIAFAWLAPRRPLTAEGVRLAVTVLILLIGPIVFQRHYTAMVLGFIATAHFLSATQCWSHLIDIGREKPLLPRGHGAIFTLGFFASLALVFIVLRMAIAEESAMMLNVSAVGVLLAGLVAWELSRATRLKEGTAMSGAMSGGWSKRALFLAIVLAGIAAMFTGVLPPVAEKLCAVSPRWKSVVPKPVNEPPKPVTQRPMQLSQSSVANRPGMDSSATTGRHRLPDSANIESSGGVRLYVQPTKKEDAQAMVKAGTAVYVRNHFMDAYTDGTWTPRVTGGKWMVDGDDGVEDGVISLYPTHLGAIEHTVFLRESDGYALPALQNVRAYRLPRIYAIPGDQCQMQTKGDIKYSALSAPLFFDAIALNSTIKVGPPPLKAPVDPGNSPAILSLFARVQELQPASGLVVDRVAALRKWMEKNLTYSKEIKGSKTLDPIGNFLLEERKGFCDFYATAACLILRLQGVPTRIAYGYATRDYDEQEGVFTFTDNTAHAWTEIFLADHGWVVCDFTPPQNVGNATGNSPPKKEPFDPTSFEDAKADVQPPEEVKMLNWIDRLKALLDRLWALDPLGLLQKVLPWIAGMILAIIAWRYWKRKQKRADRNGRRAFADDLRQPIYYTELVRICTAAGHTKMPGSTPREYLRALNKVGMIGPEFKPMLTYHYQFRYEDAPPDSAQEKEFLRVVRQLETRLATTQSRDLQSV